MMLMSTEDFAKRLDEFARERGQNNPFDNHSKMVNETSQFQENLLQRQMKHRKKKDRDIWKVRNAAMNSLLH